MHPRQVRQLRVRGWFPKIAAPVPRGAVSKQVIAVVVRFVTFLSQTEVRAVDASAADGPFVEAVLTVLDTMQRAENRLHFAQLWLMLGVMSITTQPVVGDTGRGVRELPSQAAVVFNKAMTKKGLQSRYRRNALMFTALFLHSPDIVKEFMLKGLVHFSRFYTNTNSRSLRWLQGGQSTGQHLGQVVQLTMQAAERGDTLSTAEVDLYIIPMARGPRTAEEKASEEKKGAEEIRGLIHPDTPREMEEIAELMMHLRVQEEQKRQDEAFAKQRKAEREAKKKAEGKLEAVRKGEADMPVSRRIGQQSLSTGAGASPQSASTSSSQLQSAATALTELSLPTDATESPHPLPSTAVLQHLPVESTHPSPPSQPIEPLAAPIPLPPTSPLPGLAFSPPSAVVDAGAVGMDTEASAAADVQDIERSEVQSSDDVMLLDRPEGKDEAPMADVQAEDAGDLDEEYQPGDEDSSDDSDSDDSAAGSEQGDSGSAVGVALHMPQRQRRAAPMRLGEATAAEIAEAEAQGFEGDAAVRPERGEVANILGARCFLAPSSEWGIEIEYLVRWAGWDASWDQWVQWKSLGAGLMVHAWWMEKVVMGENLRAWWQARCERIEAREVSLLTERTAMLVEKATLVAKNTQLQAEKTALEQRVADLEARLGGGHC